MKSERRLARFGVISTLVLLIATITTLYIGSTGTPELIGQTEPAPSVPLQTVSLSK
jgi:hypothetical protein